MLKFNKLIAIFCLTVLSSLAIAQDWSLRVNSGITANRSIADGYYFSFDVGVPINHFIQIAPTFSFASIGTSGFTYYSANDEGFTTVGMPIEGPERDLETKDLMGSVNLLVLINPIKIFTGRENTSRHEWLIGSGYGYKSYVQTESLYTRNNQDWDLSNSSTKVSSGFEPYFFKTMYNYSISENLLTGVVVGLDGYDGEGTFNAGLQFGVRF